MKSILKNVSGIIGCFGGIVFTVSDKYIKTFDDLSVKQSARFVDHEVYGQKQITEKTGDNLDTITFSMQLTTHFNVSPLVDLALLKTIKSKGQPQRLVVGPNNFGKFTVRELSHEWIHISHHGFPQVLQIELSLVEYVDVLSSQAITALSTDEFMKTTTGKGGPVRLPGSSDALKYRDLQPKG